MDSFLESCLSNLERINLLLSIRINVVKDKRESCSFKSYKKYVNVDRIILSESSSENLIKISAKRIILKINCRRI